ncbi:MAG: tetratricopeptide repeat protein [Bacteroidota bacterium]
MKNFFANKTAFKICICLLLFLCFQKKVLAQKQTIQLNEIVLPTTANIDLLDVINAYEYYIKDKSNKAYKILINSKNNNLYEKSFFLGYLELEKNKPQKAILNFNNAIRIKKTANVFFYRAIAFSRVKNYNAALSDYHNAIKLDSLMYQAYNNIALLKLENQGTGDLHQRDLELSKTMLLKSIEQEQNDKNVYFNLGLVCMSLNQFKEALTYLNKSILIDPYFDKAIYCRGLTKYYLRSYPEALADFYSCKSYNYNVEMCNEFIVLIEKIITAFAK